MKNQIKAYRDDLLDNKFNEIRTIFMAVKWEEEILPFKKNHPI